MLNLNDILLTQDMIEKRHLECYNKENTGGDYEIFTYNSYSFI